MIVHRADLADVPTDGDQLIQRRLVDEVTRVMLAIPSHVRWEGVGRNGSALQEGEDVAGAIECILREFVQLGDETLDGDLFGNYMGSHKSPRRAPSAPQSHRETKICRGFRGSTRIKSGKRNPRKSAQSAALLGCSALYPCAFR